MGDFAYDPAMNRFVDKMVSEHGFDRQQLHDVLAQTKRLDYVLKLMDRQAPTTRPPAGPNGAWLRYRGKFITPDNVQNGVVFWNQYQNALQRAQQVYGVPPEIIVGIIGVETRWGRVMGKTRIIDALATLSFAYPRRAEYFSGELETFLLMAREEGDDPLNLKGSFAGRWGMVNLCRPHLRAMRLISTATVISTCGILKMPSAAWLITLRRTVGNQVKKWRYRPMGKLQRLKMALKLTTPLLRWQKLV